MTIVRVRVESGQTLAALDRLAQLRGAQRGLAAGGALILSRLATYPPQRPNSRYRRTGTLGRRWTMRQQGLQVTVGNNTPYAPEVQGDKQLAFHRETGWQTPEDVVEKHGREIEAIILSYLSQG